MLRQTARTLFPSATFPPRAELRATYRVHADGGLTPIKAGSRGNLTVHCPYEGCNAILIREVNADALADGYFQCASCHRKSLGAGARASMRRREAGTLRATQHGMRIPPA